MGIKKIAAIASISVLSLGSIQSVKSQQAELIADTINQFHPNGKKYGRHIMTEQGKIVGEGMYVDGKKVGLWTKYYLDGNKESDINYATDGTTRGPATFYYPNGNIKEQGNRQLNKWVGDYRFYYENGTVKYNRHYASNGKREGTQEYFHKNGNIYIVGIWHNGEESGELSTYYEDGSLQDKKYFNRGTLDPAHTVSYQVGEVFDPLSKKYNKKKELENFNGTGQHTTYTSDKKPLQTGYFKNGHLFVGKRFEYDEITGNLKKTYEYENGTLKNTIYHEK